MREPSLRTSRLAIAGGLLAVSAVAGAGFMLGRTTSPRQEAPPVVTPSQPPPSRPNPEEPRILGRIDIIAFGNRAADAASSGDPLPPDIAKAVGRRFDIPLPFGCEGPTLETSGASLRWNYESSQQVLRISVDPTRWKAEDWSLKQGDEAPGLRGFWMRRPWSSADHCPQVVGSAAAISDQPVILPGQTLALAETLSEDSPRGDKPYEIAQRIPSDRFAAPLGFRLRLIGRIERLPGGQTVQCVQPGGIEQQPRCLIGMSLDELRIENPASNQILGTWSLRPASSAGR